ncbi:MAG: DUF4097 family beta strand repeat-containing protein, partial [Candidatus Rokuibacteriota bacterium]
LLRGINATSVDASTVDGDIVYDGTIRDDGRYSLATHDGDLAVTIPERTNATVDIQTFSGSIDASFPVQITEIRKDRRFSIIFGRGTARLELQSFDGDIRLVRPGEVALPQSDRHDKDHNKYKEKHE